LGDTKQTFKHKVCSPAFFGADIDIDIPSAKEVRGLELFLYESDKNFEHFENRSKIEA
jgi:hypothetical protein